MAFSFGTPNATTGQQSSTPSFSFGGTPAQSSSLFGQPQQTATPTSSFSFGTQQNNNVTQNNQNNAAKPSFSFGATPSSAAPTTTFSFGGANNQNSSAGNVNSGLFGQTPNNQNNGGLFGNTQNQAQAQNTGGLFSNATKPQTNGLFGGQASTNTGLFGSQQPQTGSNTAGLFGQSVQGQQGGLNNQASQPNQQNAQNQQNFFGQNQANQQNMQQQQQQQQFQQLQQSQMQPSMAQSIYGQTSNQPQFSWSRPTQSLGPPTMPTFNVAPATSLSQTQFNPAATIPAAPATYGPAQPASIQDQLSRLKNAWDPTHSDCMFQAYFYNRVDPGTASLYTKPDHHKQAAWDDAVAKRPDNSVVPVLGVGFSDLQTRVNGQQQQIFAYRTRIHEVADKLKELGDRHLLHAAPKVDVARRRHIELSQRALELAARVQVLRCRGYALRPEEEQLRTKLAELQKRLRNPETFGRVDEIWAKMTLIRAKQRTVEQDIEARGYVASIELEGDGEQHAEQVFRDNNKSLQFLSSIIKTDLAEVEREIEKFQAKSK